MAKKNLENKLVAVIRVRGRAKVRESISETLDRLNLRHANNLVILFGTKSNLGMVDKCKDFVTFGEINKDTLMKLLEKKEGVQEMPKDTVEGILAGKKSLREMNVSIPIRMKPPRHGYESIKQGYAAGGALGYRGEEINSLIRRMM